MFNGEFYSKGKFLLTGEYLVLSGAKALAVPLRYGQQMVARPLSRPGYLIWETFVLGKPWFNATFHLPEMSLIYASDEPTGAFVEKVLQASVRLRPELMSGNEGYHLQHHINFDLQWGLGSSSSLISNMAWWLEVSPLELYRELFHGSGYDVICSRASKPVLYQIKGNLPVYHETAFNPPFTSEIFFVYLGRKQDTQRSVDEFREKGRVTPAVVHEVTELTNAMIRALKLQDFQAIMARHEQIVSSLIGMIPVKDALFPDFPGTVKSLGAWGGDFAMIASDIGYDAVKDYFAAKNLPVLFRWKEIVF